MPHERVLSLLGKLVSIPSVNPACGAEAALCGESRLADFLMEWGRERKLRCERHEAGAAGGMSRPCVLFTAGSERADAPELLFGVHLDTVWPAGMERPFELRPCGDGAVAGLGAVDDKGSMCAALLALERLPGSSPCRVRVLCTSDEESGFLGINHMVPGILRPDAAVVMEGTSLDVVRCHKGAVRYKVITRGVSVHSSLVPQGENAIYPMAKLIAATERHAAELLRGPLRHALLGTPTLSLGTIRGGVQPNAVPDFCEFVVDRRYLPGENVEEIRRGLERVYDACGVAYELTGPHSHSGAFEAPPDGRWVDRVVRAVRRHHAGAQVRGATYATEASRLSESGVPAVVFGPGSVGCAHSPGERIAPGEIAAAADCLLEIARNFTGAAGAGGPPVTRSL